MSQLPQPSCQSFTINDVAFVFPHVEGADAVLWGNKQLLKEASPYWARAFDGGFLESHNKLELLSQWQEHARADLLTALRNGALSSSNGGSACQKATEDRRVGAVRRPGSTSGRCASEPRRQLNEDNALAHALGSMACNYDEIRQAAMTVALRHIDAIRASNGPASITQMIIAEDDRRIRKHLSGVVEEWIKAPSGSAVTEHPNRNKR